MREKKEGRFYQKFGKSTLVIGLFMLIIPVVFFYMLDNVSLSPGEESEGINGGEIIFSISIAILATSFLVWVKHYMESRPYLGLAIGISAFILFVYALYQKFKGPYTIGFTIVIGIVIFSYLGMYFVKYRREYELTRPEDFEDARLNPRKI